MAKQLTDLQQINKQEISDNDLIWLRDISENRDKKANVGDVFGRPLEGWISVVTDIFTFKSYDNVKKIGVITVNAGGLKRYAVGQRLNFIQKTANKYAIIIAQTDTELKVLMLNNAILENVPITKIKYSQSFAPQTDTATNFFGTLLQGQIDGMPVLLTTKNKESDPDVAPQDGYVVLQMTLADE